MSKPFELDLLEKQLFVWEGSKDPRVVWNMILGIRAGSAFRPIFLEPIRGEPNAYQLDSTVFEPNPDDLWPRLKDGGHYRALAHLIESTPVVSIVESVSMPRRHNAIPIQEVELERDPYFEENNRYKGGIYTAIPTQEDIDYMRSQLKKARKNQGISRFPFFFS